MSLTLFAASLLAAAAGGPANDVMAGLAGTWQMTGCEQNGSRAPDEWVAKRRLAITAEGRFTATTDDVAETNSGEVVLHPGGTPPSLDLRTDRGPFAGKTVYCIYERDGDELKVCFACFGTDRPTTFTSGAGSGHVLTAYKRSRVK
jgi:uncharacterized protein (TIGR03067 family)